MTLLCISKDNSLIGVDYYRAQVAVPNAFKPTLQMSVSANKSQTNNNVTIKSDHPVVLTDSIGQKTSTDAFVMRTSFTALQAVEATEDREAIFDSHIAFLMAAKPSILDGRLPDEPVVIV